MTIEELEFHTKNKNLQNRFNNKSQQKIPLRQLASDQNSIRSSHSSFFRKTNRAVDPASIYGHLVKKIIDVRDVTHGKPSETMDPIKDIF